MPTRRSGRGSPALAVDGVLILRGKVLLVRRDRPPFAGSWALPGGFVEIGEAAERAVLRELREETGVRAEVDRLVGFYSDPGRDSRGHVASAVYLLRNARGTPQGGDDAREAAWWPIDRRPSLAFDHERILDEAIVLWRAGRGRMHGARRRG